MLTVTEQVEAWDKAKELSIKIISLGKDLDDCASCDWPSIETSRLFNLEVAYKTKQIIKGENFKNNLGPKIIDCFESEINKELINVK